MGKHRRQCRTTKRCPQEIFDWHLAAPVKQWLCFFELATPSWGKQLSCGLQCAHANSRLHSDGLSPALRLKLRGQ